MTTPRLHEIHAETTPTLAAARRLDPAARMPAFLDVPREARQALREIDVVAIGAGSVGLATIQAVAPLGPRSLTIVDPAAFKAESLLTHASLSHRDIGRPKALVAGVRAKAASPRSRVFVFEGPFEALPIPLIARASHLLVATDGLRVELRIAQAALHLGAELIQGSVWGPGLVAHVRSLAATEDGSGPSLCCAFTRDEWQQADDGSVFSCAGGPELESAWAPSRAPTASVAPLCAAAGNLVALELVRRVLGIGDRSESRQIELCAYDFRTTVSHLMRRADCPLNHQRMRLLPLAGGLGAQTPRDLLEQSGYGDADPKRVTLTVEGRRFAKLTACHCHAHEVLERFVSMEGPAGACPRCTTPRTVHPLYTFSEVTAAVLGSQLDRPLAKLGARAPASVRVRGDRGACLIYRDLPESGVPEEIAG
jgi:molybdopterin/thiamine biosynthesis adenylyltransferase